MNLLNNLGFHPDIQRNERSTNKLHRKSNTRNYY